MQSRRPRKIGTIMILVVGYLAFAQTPSSLWALPEVDFRFAENRFVNITADGFLSPQQINQLTYDCPRRGRVHVIATGILLQQPRPQGAGNTVAISISLNSLEHPGDRRHDYEVTSPDLLTANYDISIQRVDFCLRGDRLVYRLLANKSFFTTTTPILQDVVITLTFIASGRPGAGAGAVGAPEDPEAEEGE
jgi:hypothetical protein